MVPLTAARYSRLDSCGADTRLHVAVHEQRQSEERRDDPRDGDQPGGRASLGGVGRAPSPATTASTESVAV